MGIESMGTNEAANVLPQTAGEIATTCVNSVAAFLSPLAGPVLAGIALYWGVKTVAGYPPKFIKNIV